MYIEGRSQAEGLDAVSIAERIWNYVPYSARVVSQQNKIVWSGHPKSALFHAPLQACRPVKLEAGPVSTDCTSPKVIGCAPAL